VEQHIILGNSFSLSHCLSQLFSTAFDSGILMVFKSTLVFKGFEVVRCFW